MTFDLKITPQIERAMLEELLRLRLAEGGRNASLAKALEIEQMICRRSLRRILALLERAEPPTIDCGIVNAIERLREVAGR